MDKYISYGACMLLLMLTRSSWAELAELEETELLNVLVVNRHGYRTPVQSELEYYINRPLYNSTYYPYGLGALTNGGRRQAYTIGKYLRSRYDGWLDRVYIPEQITTRTSYWDRTKMTALTAMAGLYPPVCSQQWNTGLGMEWQPIPYTMLSKEMDDLVFFENCDAYRTAISELIKSGANTIYAQYSDTFQLLSKYSGANITSLFTVILLAGAINGQENYGIPPPEWAVELSKEIDELEGIGFKTLFSTDEIIRLSFGVALNDFLNASATILAGESVQPRLTVMSTHDMNVASAMAAARVFYQHRPYYGATFSLELRQNTTSGRYGFAAVYAAEPGYPGEVLRVEGCGDEALCDYDTFLELTANYTITRDDRNAACDA